MVSCGYLFSKTDSYLELICKNIYYSDINKDRLVDFSKV